MEPYFISDSYAVKEQGGWNPRYVPKITEIPQVYTPLKYFEDRKLYRNHVRYYIVKKLYPDLPNSIINQFLDSMYNQNLRGQVMKHVFERWMIRRGIKIPRGQRSCSRITMRKPVNVNEIFSVVKTLAPQFGVSIIQCRKTYSKLRVRFSALLPRYFAAVLIAVNTLSTKRGWFSRLATISKCSVGSLNKDYHNALKFL